MKVNITILFVILTLIIGCKNEPKGPSVSETIAKGEGLLSKKEQLINQLTQKGDSLVAEIAKIDFPEKEQYHQRMIEIFEEAKTDFANMDDRFEQLKANLVKAEEMSKAGKTLSEIEAALPQSAIDMNYYEVYYNHKLSQVNGLIEEASAKVEAIRKRSQNQK